MWKMAPAGKIHNCSLYEAEGPAVDWKGNFVACKFFVKNPKLAGAEDAEQSKKISETKSLSVTEAKTKTETTSETKTEPIPDVKKTETSEKDTACHSSQGEGQETEIHQTEKKRGRRKKQEEAIPGQLSLF